MKHCAHSRPVRLAILAYLDDCEYGQPMTARQWLEQMELERPALFWWLDIRGAG